MAGWDYQRGWNCCENRIQPVWFFSLIIGRERVMNASRVDLPSAVQQEIALFCQEHHIARFAFYGSFIRNALKPASDIDVLVEFEPGHVPELFRLAGMQNQLTRILGRPVDLRTPDGLSPYFRGEVLDQAEVHYEQG